MSISPLSPTVRTLEATLETWMMMECCTLGGSWSACGSRPIGERCRQGGRNWGKMPRSSAVGDQCLCMCRSEASATPSTWLAVPESQVLRAESTFEVYPLAEPAPNAIRTAAYLRRTRSHALPPLSHSSRAPSVMDCILPGLVHPIRRRVST